MKNENELKITVRPETLMNVSKMIDSSFTGVTQPICTVWAAGLCPFKKDQRPSCTGCVHFEHTVQLVAKEIKKTPRRSAVVRKRRDLVRKPGGGYTISSEVADIDITQGDPSRGDPGFFTASLRKKEIKSTEQKAKEIRGRLRDQGEAAVLSILSAAEKREVEREAWVILRRKYGLKGARTLATPEEVKKIMEEVVRNTKGK